jgi:drug/metabolite transporter (DMT)-like permease
MIPILLAAASAIVWGTADYAGGRATRRMDALRVATCSKVLSLPVLALYLALMPATLVPATAAWGFAAGMVGIVALIIFYRALSAGAMAVVAPVSAVTTAVLPLAFGLLAGDRPGRWELAGVACAVAAIGLVSLAPAPPGAPGARVTPRLVGAALAAGAGFGLFFVLLDRGDLVAGGAAGLWPVAAAQVGALATGATLLAHAGRAAARAGRAAPGDGRAAPRDGWRAVRGLLPLLAVVGVLDMTANGLYLIAVRDGMLSIVAPLAALYPVSTVLLALLVDRERIRPAQVAGLGLAVAALVMVAS